MLCFLAAVIAIGASVWIVERLIGMQKATPSKKLSEIWADYKRAKTDADSFFERLLLAILLVLIVKKRGVLALAAAIIVAMGGLVSGSLRHRLVAHTERTSPCGQGLM